MAADDTPGPKKQPRFKGTGAPATSADLNILGNYSALVGNRKAGTNAERTTATSAGEVWPGLEWFETDTNLVFVYQSSSVWAQVLAGPAQHLANPGVPVAGIAVPNGAVNLPQGLQFKTGIVTSGTSVAFGNEYMPAIGFSPSFPVTLLSISITQIEADGAVAASKVAVDVATKDQFRVLYPGGSASTKRSFLYFAVGY